MGKAKGKIKLLKRKFKALTRALKKAKKQARKGSRKESAKGKATNDGVPEHPHDPEPTQNQNQMIDLAAAPDSAADSSHVSWGESSWDGSKISKFPDLPSPPQWIATSVQLVATIDDELKKCWGALIDAKSIDAAAE